MKKLARLYASAIAGGLLIVAVSILNAQTTRTVQDGVFTDAQAARGQSLYTQQCASCHGATLQGASAPPLQGEGFVTRWQTEPLSVLVSKIRATMPVDAAGRLTPEQSVDLVAHLLKSGGYRAGAQELPAAEADTRRIGWPARAATAGTRAASNGAVRPPVGNLAQLMRGVFFPNANMIFTVQTQDPAAPPPKPAPDAQANGFSWVSWGAGIYPGWQLVDNAAVTLADISPIMLNADLRCENGRLAPVTDPDWIRFTEQMITVSTQLYRLSQTRNQEAVSDATGDLTDACAACHQAYRDVRGRGAAPPNPANPQQGNASRCSPRQAAR
jgi:mono/diheme cytochrome c family protein